MKRALSCSEIEQTCSHFAFPKRLKPDSGRFCLFNPTSRSSRTLPLTPETLHTLSSESSAPQDLTQSIEQWASNCDSCSEAEMVPPQAPSVASNVSGQRRVSKLSYRRQRSQSPSKKSSPQYRSRNMADASVFVDHFPEPPPDVEDQLKQIFEVSMLEDIGKASFGQGLLGRSVVQNGAGELAERYCHKSRQMAKDCTGEGQWKSWLLTGLVEPMQELWPDIVKLSASEKRRFIGFAFVTWLILPQHGYLNFDPLRHPLRIYLAPLRLFQFILNPVHPQLSLRCPLNSTPSFHRRQFSVRHPTLPAISLPTIQIVFPYLSRTYVLVFPIPLFPSSKAGYYGTFRTTIVSLASHTNRQLVCIFLLSF